MSVPRAHTLWLAELRREGSTPLVIPLTLPAPFGVGRSVQAVTADLTAALEDGWMEEACYLELMSGAPELAPEVVQLTVELPERGPQTPAINISLPAAISRIESGFTVIIPGLSVDAWGQDKASALQSAKQTVLAEIVRQDRREDPRKIVEICWWSELVLHEVQPLLHWYTFHERRERALARERQQQRQLERCARPLPESTAYEMEDIRKDLRRALIAKVSAGILLVGPQGSGKSVLIADEAHATDSAFPISFAGKGDNKPVWSTTAARLEHALTEAGPWQSNLSKLCDELARERVWLHVANLAELFEVGRYEGNETSIAEYMRPWLGRSEIAIISECTPEQLSVLDARYPGFLEHFARVVVPAPDDARLARVVSRFIQASGAISPSAGDEAIRLQRRFVPYSGFPGRTLRFLRALENSLPPPVRPRDVTDRFCEESGIPREFIDPSMVLSHPMLTRAFDSALFGQPDAVSALVDVAVAIKADVAPRGKPISTLLLTGPTGVGKTEAARALAAVLFGAKDRMIRFDMSEFATQAAISSLTTSPDPHGEGRLTGAVRRQPFAVVLLDEIEKAHPDLFDLLLAVLGEGRLTDHRGRVADFCSTVIVMTTNLGAELAMRARIGISRTEELSSSLKEAIYRSLRPELVNRLDRIIAFHPLSQPALMRVLDRELAALEKHPALADRHATLLVSPDAAAWLAHRGHDPARGARPLQRVLRDELVSKIAVALDAAPDIDAPKIDVTVQDDALAVRFTARPSKEPSLSMLERLSSVRRKLQSVIDGETFAEHDSAVQIAERSARAACAGGRHSQIDIEALRDGPAPLNTLRLCLDKVLALEAASLSSTLQVIRQTPEEIAREQAELHESETRRIDAERALHQRVHPLWDLSYIGLWSPGEQRQPHVAHWVDLLIEQARALDIEVTHRDVWSTIDGKLLAADVHGPKPGQANRWAGAELWLEGSCAARLVEHLPGLYSLPAANPKETVRCLVIMATPAMMNIPACCDRASVGVPLFPKPKGTGAVDERFIPPRPESPLRKLTYEGRVTPWPPTTPTAELLQQAIGSHLTSNRMPSSDPA